MSYLEGWLASTVMAGESGSSCRSGLGAGPHAACGVALVADGGVLCSVSRWGEGPRTGAAPAGGGTSE